MYRIDHETKQPYDWSDVHPDEVANWQRHGFVVAEPVTIKQPHTRKRKGK